MPRRAVDVTVLADFCQNHLGDPRGYRAPPGYPESLSLAIIDSIWSMGVKYRSVENVVARYRKWVADHGGDADHEGAQSLQEAIARAGGAAEFSRSVVRNAARTSTRNGVLKASAVNTGADALLRHGIDTTADFRARAGTLEVEHEWSAVPGQRSGISWHYLRILAGVDDVKADRMVCRFVSRAVGRTVANTAAHQLATEAHDALRVAAPGLTLRALDHAIWSFERAQRRPAKT